MAVFYDSSVRFDPSSLPLRNAIDNATTLGRNGKGCVVVAGCGNRCTTIHFPANYDKVLAVGGIDRFGIRSGSSQCINTNVPCEHWNSLTGGSCPGNYLDVMAPGTYVYSTFANNSYGHADMTHLSSAFVSGVAALMLSKNNNLTEQEVRDIIRITARKISTHVYTYNPNYPYGDWNARMGYGFVNSYQSVKKALDYKLYTKDDANDNGYEPNFSTFFDSPDIWIRRNKDGGTTHQDAFRGDTNYVYVRVHNTGSVLSSPGDSLIVYAKKIVTSSNPNANFATWPNYWDKLGGVEISGVPANGNKIFCVPVYFLPIHNKYTVQTIVKSNNNPLSYSLASNNVFNIQYNNKVSIKGTSN